MIVEFADKELEDAYGNPRYHGKIGPARVKKFREIVVYLQALPHSGALFMAALYKPHKLRGQRAGQIGLWITENVRLIVEIRPSENGETVTIIEIEDYH